jgi:photosystem II stability/assembly factor-like uncharacterized protein
MFTDCENNNEETEEKTDWEILSQIDINENIAARVLYFYDEQFGFIGCSADDTSNYLFKTTNGGVDWERLDVKLIDNTFGADYVSVNDIFFISKDVGFLTTDELSNYKTIDAGESWQKMENLTMANYMQIYFQNENNGFAFGGNSENFARTEDKGVTWTVIADGYNKNVFNGAVEKVCFANETTKIGYVYESFDNKIFKTEDGGSSWEHIYSISTDYSITDMLFTDDNTGYILTWEKIFKTTDGGENWNIINETIGGSNLTMSSTNKMYLINEWNVYISDNNGVSFSKMNHDSDNYYLSEIFILDDSFGIAMDEDGNVLKMTK